MVGSRRPKWSLVRLGFDFLGISGGEGTPMVYDDNFWFTFDNVVLAGSYGPMVDQFETEGSLPIYDWDAVVGTSFDFDNSVPTYCLGEDEGQSDCEIPAPETRDIMSLQFDEDLVNLAQPAGSAVGAVRNSPHHDGRQRPQSGLRARIFRLLGRGSVRPPPEPPCLDWLVLAKDKHPGWRPGCVLLERVPQMGGHFPPNDETITRRSLLRFFVTLVARLGICVAALMLFLTTPRFLAMVSAGCEQGRFGSPAPAASVPA